MREPACRPPPRGASAAPSTAAPSPGRPPRALCVIGDCAAAAGPRSRRDRRPAALSCGGVGVRARLDSRSHAGLALSASCSRSKTEAARTRRRCSAARSCSRHEYRTRARTVRELRRAISPPSHGGSAMRDVEIAEPSALRRVRGEAHATQGAQARRRPSVRRRRGRLPELPDRDGRLRASRARATQGRNALKLSASAAQRACPCRRDRGSAG